MVHFVALAQTAQNRNRVLDGRLLDEDRLEAALQRGVLFDVLAVLVEGRGADAVQLAARQHRFEQVAGIHRAFRGAGADDGVQLVDKENDLAGRIDHFLEHRLEAFLELAAEFGSRNQCAHIERDQFAVLQAFRHVLADDALGQTFDDCGLADAGLADEDGIVLGGGTTPG